MVTHIPLLFLLTKYKCMVVKYMFDKLSKFICNFIDKKDEIDSLQFSSDMYKNKCNSYKLLSIGMEYELNHDYDLALKTYYAANDMYQNSKAMAHIAICLKHLGKIDEAKSMIIGMRPQVAHSESEKIGKLLEEGFWGEPDYYEARKWYMTNAWHNSNDENIIISKENLKRILKEFPFDDYCYKCGKKLVDELIYFSNSTFEPQTEFCSDCIEIAPFIYTLNPQTGEMTRSTFQCDWKALSNEKGEFPLLNSILPDDKHSH